MKIEKVNNNKIRCTLTKEDLADRQLKLSELAYGTEKARNLFKDMIQQANYEFGFEVDDNIPLMVEAIPLSTESIVLMISKVEYPEELDTRFSKFSEPDEEFLATESEADQPIEDIKGAAEIIDLFKKAMGQTDKPADKSAKDEKPKVATTEESKAEKVAEAPKAAAIEAPKDVVKLFEIDNLDQACRLARVINSYYQGENWLYKNSGNNKFYILMHKSQHTPIEFNKICNRVSEYARQKNYTPAIGAFFGEHGNLILREDAIKVLASI